MKKKPNSPFTHVGSIYNGWDFGGDKGYSQYVINKELSKNGELIDFVNLVQQYTLSNELHFKLMQSLFSYSKRPGYKQFPWIWKSRAKGVTVRQGESSTINKEVEIIAKYYEESLDNAEKYYEILKSSPKGKEKLKWLKRVYGLENK